MKQFFLIFSLVFLISCVSVVVNNGTEGTLHSNTNNMETKQAVFAGGCFWCMEGIFEAQPGVEEAESGYIGGDEKTANYSDVSSGNTQHREAVQVSYNPDEISYETLVELYWTQIDPTDPDGQFADRGFQYTTAIYYSDDLEKAIAEKSKKNLGDSQKFDAPIATLLLPIEEFYRAEEYHQDYYKNAAFRYKLYKKGSGREGFIEENWKSRIEELEENIVGVPLVGTHKGNLTGGHPQGVPLQERLTPLQYKVTQEDATERAFNNEYWDNTEDGIYVDIVDGTPLFSSLDKYESGTGWPSFTKPIDDSHVVEREDKKLFMTRIEIRSKNADSHLGHLFSDGPVDKGGNRYCMNSAALKFIPVEQLEEKGYGEYKKLFE